MILTAMRRRSRWLLASALMFSPILGCDGGSGGGGGRSTPTQAIRYLQVGGTWSGDWIVYGIVVNRVTLHVGQDGANVNGTLWLTIGQQGTYNMPMQATVGPDNSVSGSGNFDFTATLGQEQIVCDCIVSNGVLSGTASLHSGGAVIPGPIVLSRTSTHASTRPSQRIQTSPLGTVLEALEAAR